MPGTSRSKCQHIVDLEKLKVTEPLLIVVTFKGTGLTRLTQNRSKYTKPSFK